MSCNRTNNLAAKLLLMFFLMAILVIAACSSKSDRVPTTGAEISQPDYDKAQVHFVWAANKDCSTCHVLETRSMTRTSLLAYQHAEAEENCLSCHDVSDLTITHKNVSKETAVRVPVKKYSQAFCFKCHGSYEDLIQSTKDSKVCTDSKGNVANPHDTHLGQSDCYNCHRMHRMSSGVKYCYTCHHAGVFECGTCHLIPAEK